MKDCWHFITKNDLIFTIRGNIHPEGFVRSVGLYFPDNNGERIYEERNYYKIVDEHGDKWVKYKCPEYIKYDEEGIKMLVPISHIKKYFDPFKISERTRFLIKKTKYYRLISILEKLIPKEDIGFIGSYLIGFPTEKSDIDIVIRGVENLEIIRNNFDIILRHLNATDKLNEDLLRISLEKYHSIYNKERNDFLGMIKNRWPTINNNLFMTKLRFVPRDNEIIFPRPHIKIQEKNVEGVVIDDIGTNFMPRFFRIKSEEGEFVIMTYFWDYTYCVKNKDIVSVSGSLFKENIILINDKENHGIKFI